MTAPNNIGPQHIKAAQGKDPRGILVFEWLPPDLQNAEDSTLAADSERLREINANRGAALTYFLRPATAAERTLLAHLASERGIELELPAQLKTAVHWASAGVRARFWPQLQTITEHGWPQQVSAHEQARVDAITRAMDQQEEVIRVAPEITTPTIDEQEN
ncbi:hypothetical protein [Mycolicibacterium sp. XJ879]